MFLFINDLHLGDKPPSGRTDAYLRDFLAKMTFALELEKKYCIGTVISGDIFNSKVARNTSHRLVRFTIALFKRFKKVYVVLGNHDVIGAQVQSVFSQPMGVILESGVVTYLGAGPIVVDGVELLGYDYNDRFEDGEQTLALPDKQADKRILVMHASLTLGTGLREQIIGDFDLCCYSHPHNCDGEEERFVNYGAVMRTMNEDWERVRTPKVCIVEPDGFGFKATPFDVPTRPWKDIWQAERTVPLEDGGSMNIELVMEMMESEEGGGFELERYLAQLDPSVAKRVRDYIAEV